MINAENPVAELLRTAVNAGLAAHALVAIDYRMQRRGLGEPRFHGLLTGVFTNVLAPVLPVGVDRHDHENRDQGDPLGYRIHAKSC